MSDQVNHPSHYKGIGGIEAIDVIEGFKLGYTLGNVIKYVLRADRKGFALVDLRKARWYLDREIEQRERAETEPAPPDKDYLVDKAEHGASWHDPVDHMANAAEILRDKAAQEVARYKEFKR